MHLDIITIFPEIFDSFLSASLIAKASNRGLLTFDRINFRDFATPPHYKVDDLPYGGGPGMVIKPEPLVAAIESCKSKRPRAPVVFFSCSGEVFSQKRAQAFSAFEEIILVCGRYEGVDQRVIYHSVDYEISIGDFVLMGAEVAAMVFIEAVGRLVDQVLGNAASLDTESFTSHGRDVEGKGILLEAPQYTRPAEFRGQKVPEVLLSGNHKQIASWRQQCSVELTKKRRPDLMLKDGIEVDT